MKVTVSKKWFKPNKIHASDANPEGVNDSLKKLMKFVILVALIRKLLT